MSSLTTKKKQQVVRWMKMTMIVINLNILRVNLTSSEAVMFEMIFSSLITLTTLATWKN